jgi:hypothetical protein
MAQSLDLLIVAPRQSWRMPQFKGRPWPDRGDGHWFRVMNPG